MLKNDYGKLSCPYYQEQLSNGVNCYFIPRKSKLKSISLLISKGNFQSDKLIQFTKIPNGTAYYLANVILNKKLKSEFILQGVLADVEVNNSSTIFNLISKEDNIFSCLSKLLERISDANINEDDVQDFLNNDPELEEVDSIKKAKRLLPKALYANSPIQDSIYPERKDALRIHASTLSKFQDCYYTPSNISIFFSLDQDPHQTLENIKDFKYPKDLTFSKGNPSLKEDYTSVFKESLTFKSNASSSYLCYGLKFPQRKAIYELYGESMFFTYELLLDVLFDKNQAFNNTLFDLKSELIQTDLVEGGEDCYISLLIRTSSPEEVRDAITRYIAHLPKGISESLFTSIRNEYYAKSLLTLSSPALLTKAFAHAFPNHISYTSLLSHTMRLPFSTFKKFTEEMRDFKSASIFAEKCDPLED